MEMAIFVGQAIPLRHYSLHTLYPASVETVARKTNRFAFSELECRRVSSLLLLVSFAPLKLLHYICLHLLVVSVLVTVFAIYFRKSV